MDISSSDMATLTVLRKELLDIKAQNISVPNIVMEYLSNRISSIESGNSVMVDWKHNSIEPFYKISKSANVYIGIYNWRIEYVKGN